MSHALARRGALMPSAAPPRAVLSCPAAARACVLAGALHGLIANLTAPSPTSSCHVLPVLSLRAILPALRRLLSVSGRVATSSSRWPSWNAVML